VDLEHIALIGHSRGGEAVVLANQFNQMGAFPDDATIPFDYHFHILAVAAIAPTEGTYLPRTSHVELRDQNYFVMGGSRDGDNGTSFPGQSQYSHTTFSGAIEAFKASIYIKDANHGQFNTSWGRNDAPTVYKFLTDERQILSGPAQRQVAKVYLTAFLNVTLKSQMAYRALFRDPRKGAAHDQLLYPQIQGITQRAGTIDGALSEVVMRYFRFPLRDFTTANPALDLTKLMEIRLEFDRSPAGAIVLDDLGLEQP
jgi:hypothetical protein